MTSTKQVWRDLLSGRFESDMRKLKRDNAKLRRAIEWALDTRAGDTLLIRGLMDYAGTALSKKGKKR